MHDMCTDDAGALAHDIDNQNDDISVVVSIVITDIMCHCTSITSTDIN